MTDNNQPNSIDVNDPRLTDFVLGELSPSETVEIQNAISESPELKAAVEEIRQTTELLGAAYLAEEPVQLLDEQRAALVTASKNPVGVTGPADATTKDISLRSDGMRTKLRPWLGLAIAAGLTGLMLGAFYFSDFGSGPFAVSSNAISRVEESAPAAEPAKKASEAGSVEFVQNANEASKKGKDLSSVEASTSQKNSEFNIQVQQARPASRAAPNVALDMHDAADGKEFGPAPANATEQPAFIREEMLGQGKSDQSGGDSFGSAGLGRGMAGGRGARGGVQAIENADSSRDLGGEAGGLGGFGGGVSAGGEAEKSAEGGDRDQGLGGFGSEAPMENAESEEETRQPGAEPFFGGGLGGGGGGMGSMPSRTPSPRPADAADPFGDERESLDLKFAMPDAEQWQDQAVQRQKFIENGPMNREGQSSGNGDAPAQQGAAGAGQQNRFSGELAQEEDSFEMEMDDDEAKSDGQSAASGLAGGGRGRRSANSRGEPAGDSNAPAVDSFDEDQEYGEKFYKEMPELAQIGGQVKSQRAAEGKALLIVDAAKTEAFVERLAKQVDPENKKLLEVEQLLELSVQKLEESQAELDKANNLGGRGTVSGKEPAKSKLVADQEVDYLLATKLYEKIQSEKAADATIVQPLLKQLSKGLAKRNAEVRKNRSWKRVKAIPNTTRLMVGDKDELDMTGMQVNVQVDGFRARVLIDCFYYNDRSRQLEGNFKLRLPDDASLYYFAFGESAYELGAKGKLAKEEFFGDETEFISLNAPDIKRAREDVWANVKESRMVPKEKAAHAYSETVRRKVDPALVEWSGAGIFNARVFPLAAKKLHRIVIGYDVNLKKEDGDWVYELDLPEQTGQCKVDLNVQPVEGVEYKIQPACDPFQAASGDRTFRRYRFHGPQKGGIRLEASGENDVMLVSNNKDEGRFLGVQVTPELPVAKVSGSSRAIFLLDTSLSSNPDKFNVWLKMLQASLDNNRDSLKQFNVAFFNVDTHMYQDEWVKNTSENVTKVIERCNEIALEGATDLYGAIEHVKSQKWVYGNGSAKQPQGPDLFLLSDGAANWGETNMRLIGRQLDEGRFGNLFAYQSGLTGTAIGNLRFLASETGGAVFTVATEDEIKTASTAHRKRPWKLESLTADGVTDLMTAGRVKWLYPGQSVTIVGRGKLTGEIKMVMTQGESEKTVTFAPKALESELASRLYGHVAVGQLESLGAKVFDLAASYARHFRVTGDTCSLLMLETEQDYQRFNIKPKEDLFVIKTKAANEIVAETLKKSADELADPKSQLMAWLDRLQTMPGMEFQIDTALKFALSDIKIEPISQPLDCQLTEKEGLSKDYLELLSQDRLDYEKIAKEANRRGGSSVDEAIKVFSSLVERNPGNLEIARDVAFTAMELKRPAQAFHLLRNVAKARPFEGSIYPALGQCLTQLGQADQAIVYYEIALSGSFQRRGENFKEIVATEYAYLLRQICSGKMESSIPKFANARLDTLQKQTPFKSADVVITMLWNTDQTDVDLHIVEPSGEECSYENTRTRSGGKITSDITTGFGPEMYYNASAPAGKYDVKVKYFNNGQSRTELRNKVHLLIYRGLGTEAESLIRRTVQLKKVGEKESVTTIGVDPAKR